MLRGLQITRRESKVNIFFKKLINSLQLRHVLVLLSLLVGLQSTCKDGGIARNTVVGSKSKSLKKARV